MRISPGDLGWMAAIIDAKGAVIRKHNAKRRTPQIVLRVDTKDRRIARRLSLLTGTSPEIKEAMGPSDFLRRGCKEHCPESHIHVDQEPSWQMPETTRWAITGAAAAVILMNLAPYMITYQDYEGDVNLALMNLVTSGQGSGMVRSSVNRLADLGWQIPRKIELKLRLTSTP